MAHELDDSWEEDQKEPTLRDINFKVPAPHIPANAVVDVLCIYLQLRTGMLTAIVGPVGSGKSSLTCEVTLEVSCIPLRRVCLCFVGRGGAPPAYNM